MGLIFEEDGKQDKAFAAFSEAIKVNNKEAKYYYHRGVLHFLKEHYESAKNDFTVAISLKSNYAYAYNDRGSCYIKLNDVKNAIKDYEKALSTTLRWPSLIII